MEQKSLVVTVICTLPKIDFFANALNEALGSNCMYFVEEEGNFLYTLPDYTRAIVGTHPSALDKEKLNNEFFSMFNYYASIKADVENVKLGVLQHVKVSNSLILISVPMTDDQQRNNMFFTALLKATKDIGGMIAMKNLDLLNDEGKLLFSHEGKSDVTEHRIAIRTDFLFYRETEETQEDRDIYESNVQFLKEKNIPVNESTEFNLRLQDIKVRSEVEVMQRIYALASIAVYTESLVNKPEQAEDVLKGLDAKYGVKSFMTRNELLYLDSKEKNQQMHMFFIWKYEACSTLLDACNLYTLPELNGTSNAAEIIKLLLSFSSIEEASKKISFKSNEDLLKSQNLMQRYKWAIQKLAAERTKLENVENTMVLERHHALNWLLTSLYGENWDTLETPA